MKNIVINGNQDVIICWLKLLIRAFDHREITIGIGCFIRSLKSMIQCIDTIQDVTMAPLPPTTSSTNIPNWKVSLSLVNREDTDCYMKLTIEFNTKEDEVYEIIDGYLSNIEDCDIGIDVKAKPKPYRDAAELLNDIVYTAEKHTKDGMN